MSFFINSFNFEFCDHQLGNAIDRCTQKIRLGGLNQTKTNISMYKGSQEKYFKSI